MHGVEADKHGMVMNIMQEHRCCLERELDPRTDLEIADPELGGFQLNHQDMFSVLISGRHESLEELMTELFFHREDMHAEMKHLEKADQQEISCSNLHMEFVVLLDCLLMTERTIPLVLPRQLQRIASQREAQRLGSLRIGTHSTLGPSC